MRRAKKQIQQEGLVKSIREKQYFKKAKTKSRIRQEAQKRTEYRQEKLKRILMS